MTSAQPVSGEWVNPGEIPVQGIADDEQKPRRAKADVPPVKLNVVLAFNERDVPATIRLLKHCAQLSGKLAYTLFLLPFKGLNFDDVKAAAETAFADVRVIADAEGVVSDWQNDQKIRDAAGPNSMFRQAAWYFYLHQSFGPWLYLEPDCWPVTKTWLTDLENEYRKSGKPFLGVTINLGDEPYLNGVAIYPANAVQLAPSLVNRTMWNQHPEFEVAFDVAGAKEVLRNAHITKLIGAGAQSVLQHNFTGEVVQQVEHGNGAIAPSRAVPDGGSIPPLANTERGDVKCDSVIATRTTAAMPMGTASIAESSNGAIKSNPEISADEHQSLGDQIRFHIDALVEIEAGIPSRHARILDGLRRKRLVPQPQRRRK